MRTGPRSLGKTEPLRGLASDFRVIAGGWDAPDIADYCQHGPPVARGFRLIEPTVWQDTFRSTGPEAYRGVGPPKNAGRWSVVVAPGTESSTRCHDASRQIREFVRQHSCGEAVNAASVKRALHRQHDASRRIVDAFLDKLPARFNHA